MPSTFNSVPFQIAVPDGLGGQVIYEQVPKWLERNAGLKVGTLRTSITGRLSLQEIAKKWKPITLEFNQGNYPAALASQAMLDAFVTAAETTGGTFTLVLEGLTKTVMFDWERANPPYIYAELTPTGVFEAVTGRLYELTVFLRERIA